MSLSRVLLMAFMIVAPFSIHAYQAQAANVLGKPCNSPSIQNLPADKKPAACQDSQSGGNPIFGADGVITAIVNLITIIVGIAAIIAIIYGGIKFITSGSNPQDVTAAREIILYAIVAIVIAALAQAIVRLFINKLFE